MTVDVGLNCTEEEAKEVDHMQMLYFQGLVSKEDFLKVFRRYFFRKNRPMNLGRLFPKPGRPALDIDTIIESRYPNGFSVEAWKIRQLRKEKALSALLTNNNSRYLYNTQHAVWEIRMRCWRRDINRELRMQYYPEYLC